jgi:hypothetical protein
MKTLVAEMTGVSSENKTTARVAGNLAKKVQTMESDMAVLKS